MKHLSGTPFPREAIGLNHRHWPRLERLARDKHSSILQTFVIYGRKKLYNIGSRSNWQTLANRTDTLLNFQCYLGNKS